MYLNKLEACESCKFKFYFSASDLEIDLDTKLPH